MNQQELAAKLNISVKQLEAKRDDKSFTKRLNIQSDNFTHEDHAFNGKKEKAGVPQFQIYEKLNPSQSQLDAAIVLVTTSHTNNEDSA